jgi:RND superfamily putative drug exporter
MNDALSTRDNGQGVTPDALRPGPLGRLAALAYRRRGRVLLAWAVALAVAFGLSAAFGGAFTTSSSVPGSDSSRRSAC